MPKGARQQLADLDRASLEELMERHPAVWASVGERLVAATKAGPSAMEAFVREAEAAAAPLRDRLQKSHFDRQVLAAARLARLSMARTLLSAATGQTAGTVKLGTWSSALVQRLFFSRGLERKPVSLRAFRLVWPLVTRKRSLMPLVQQRGIYCFYTRELVSEVAALIGDRLAIEVAAGDGTFARFLSAAGANIKASDDQSWGHAVSYPADVTKQDAAAALQQQKPRAVVCSFPPPGNGFERRIFATASVELYVVVTSRHRFAAGDWRAYEDQGGFEWTVDERLSRLVLPPEVDPAVLVFRRRGGQTSSGPSSSEREMVSSIE